MRYETFGDSPYSFSIVNDAVKPTLKFLGNLSTPKMARECSPLSSKIFTNKSDAPFTTFGESSQFSPAWK